MRRDRGRPPRSLGRAVAAVQRLLVEIYRLELDLRAEAFLLEPAAARRWLGGDGPRSGVLVLEEADVMHLGLYIDPRDRGDPDTLVEETSHLVCLAWHAAQHRPVSRLALELQSEVDRYAVARVRGRGGLAHFAGFRWADGMSAPARLRYETAHRAAARYCLDLARRYPRRADLPGLLAELRRFYRAPAARKLAAGDAPV